MKTDRFTVKKQSGKVKLPVKVGNGTVLATALPLKDTEYYQIAAHGDYVQEMH